MASTPNESPIRRKAMSTARALTAFLAASAPLPAQQDKEHERRPQEHAAPPPKPKEAPAPRPSHESRRDAPPESRHESKPEPRRESRPEPRMEPRREPRTEPRPEPRREARPAPKPEPRIESKREPSSGLPQGRNAGVVAPRRSAPPPSTRPEGPHGDVRPAPNVVHVRGGGEIHRTSAGVIREVHTPGGAVIRHSPSGARHVEVVRPGGTVIVANATGRHGYVQRPVVINNYHFVQRTYIFNGVPQARIYRPWGYGGRIYHIYTPVYYYRPAFYGWVYTPWVRPIRYGWGWEARPWYGYYGGYFVPYRTYVSPAFWLADFLIATTLEAAFLAQRATVTAPPVEYSGSTALTPEVKQAIANEVRRQMEQEREDRERSRDYASSDAAPALFSERGPRVFLVAGPVLADAGRQDCALVEGDVLQLLRTPSHSSEWADVKVLSSRGGSCPRGSVVAVRLTDLQEMQNHLRASLDQGMSTLHAEQGRNGIPVLPAQAVGTVSAPYAEEVRPDGNAADEINRAVQEANRSEQDIINQGPQEPGGSATISLGMTIAEVERAMGRPKNTVDLGSKKIYLYKDLKITFLNGRVSDVQ